ncbi:MAG: citramalate synthase [Termitinemataceae bacterium]|nr:MAG: citramalate synthase [Termitinemataceae bacterium]
MESNVDIEIFDTTLRDGAQGPGISFSLNDKIAVVRALDKLAISFIEAGNPGSNPKDIEFFKEAKNLDLKYAKLCAFGSTRKKNIEASDDAQLQSLLSAQTEYVVIFGKSSALHVSEVLKTSGEENISMITQSVEFLVKNGRKVFFDAEHFFDGLRLSQDYALRTIAAAANAGAQRIILCDTNGGTFPDEIKRGVNLAAAHLCKGALTNVPSLGIHCHNDCGLAVAGSLAAIEGGCTQVQGTLLGFGERCGNTNLSSLIPNIEIKMDKRCLYPAHLHRLLEVTRKVAEIANFNMSADMPYIGNHAFSHKAGMHADAILKISSSFEHVEPSLIGNDRHFLMSEQGGRSAIAERVRKIDAKITKDDPAIAVISKKLKDLEADGWSFEAAEASFEILVRKVLGTYKKFFEILAYRVQSEYPKGKSLDCCHAWVKVLVNGQTEIAAAEGDGPVNALDGALRRSLVRFYPQLEQMHLSDYKVRVIDGKDATAAKVRVLIESGLKGAQTASSWTTVGVSADILEASCKALEDSIDYKLIFSTSDNDKRYL